MTQNDTKLLSVRSLALMLGEPERAIRARVARRQLPFVRLGGSIRFRPRDIEAFLESLPGVTVQEARQRAREAA